MGDGWVPWDVPTRDNRWKPYKARPILGQECQAQCVISLALTQVQGR